MTIIEIGQTVENADRTKPYETFIRSIKIGPFTTDAAILATFPGLDESARSTVSVAAVRDNSRASYTRHTSLANMQAEQRSFYWDNAAQTLYIHFIPSTNPFESLFLGLAEGYCDDELVYIDDIPYLPLIERSVNIEYEQDIENYDQPALLNGSVVLNNLNGRLDRLKDQLVYGNVVLQYYLAKTGGPYTASDLVQLASMYVEDYDIGIRNVSLNVQDVRDSQNASIPQDVFTATDYANMGDTTLGQVIPILWGTPREIPCVITNDTVTTGDVTYRAALLLTAIGTVQVETETGVWSTVTPSSTTLASGEFTLSAANGRDGTTPLNAKLVAPTGIAITRLTDIIKDANDRFLNISYTAGSYNTTEWEAEETSIDNGALFLDSETELLDVIATIQNGANTGFRYEITADGRRTIRVDNESRTVAMHIPNVVIENRDNLTVETDSSLLVARAVVEYNPSYVTDAVSRVVDSSSFDTVLETYNQQPQKTFETILTTSSDAQDRATFALSRFDTIRGSIELTLMGSSYLSLRIYDIVTIELTPDEPTNQTRPFYGTWKCKVLSIAPDARLITNTIRAMLIEEVV